MLGGSLANRSRLIVREAKRHLHVVSQAIIRLGE